MKMLAAGRKCQVFLYFGSLKNPFRALIRARREVHFEIFEIVDQRAGFLRSLMPIGRESRTATLLGDGRVLVAGGCIPAGITW
jgi:hypothetical protein